MSKRIRGMKPYIFVRQWVLLECRRLDVQEFVGVPLREAMPLYKIFVIWIAIKLLGTINHE